MLAPADRQKRRKLRLRANTRTCWDVKLLCDTLKSTCFTHPVPRLHCLSGLLKLLGRCCPGPPDLSKMGGEQGSDGEGKEEGETHDGK